MPLHRLCLTALHQTRSELRLLELKHSHPERFTTSKTQNHSILRWAGTQTELKELLMALELEGVIHNPNNTKASFTDVVKAFERTLNVSIGEAKYIKRDILRRNTKKTIFIDRLRRSLLNDEF